MLVFISFWLIRAYYVRKTRDPDGPRSRKERREAMRKEGWTGTVIVLLTPIELIITIIYFINPLWLSLSFLMIPELVRWFGLILMLASIPLVTWVHQTLGRSYSYALETKNEQTLVTTGPFGRLRHPLYSAHNIFNLGKVFLTLNILLTVIAILGIPITYARIRDEERMMIKQFGSEYEQYMKRTGRIFPKI